MKFTQAANAGPELLHDTKRCISEALQAECKFKLFCELGLSILISRSVSAALLGVAFAPRLQVSSITFLNKCASKVKKLEISEPVS